MEQVKEKKKDILDLIREGDEVNVVYFRSGPNHPWRKYRITLTPEEKKAERKSRWGTSSDEDEKRMRWWNNFRPSHYREIDSWLTESDLKEAERWRSEYN